MPTPTPLSEYTTVELNYGAAKAFEAALAGEQSKLQGETLWYRLVEGGNAPRYVRLRPRASLASILDEHADQALPDKVNGCLQINLHRKCARTSLNAIHKAVRSSSTRNLPRKVHIRSLSAARHRSS